MGLLLALNRRSLESLRLLIVPNSAHAWSRNLLTGQEALDIALVIANEPAVLWTQIVALSKPVALG